MTIKYTLLLFLLVLIPLNLIIAQDWELVWSDEFDGPEIDSTKWTHEVNAWGGGNNELQYYVDRSENSFISDGKLIIRAIKETYTGPEGTRDYTSARLNSKFKGDWLYGKMEARLKVPGDQGTWPAFWMLPSDWVYGGWAASGEIDIMEHRGDIPGRVYGTIHYGGEWPNNTHSGGIWEGSDLSQDFHVYTLEWEPYEFRWYIDGTHYHTETGWYSEAAPYPAPFDQRFHILLNLAIGGGFLPDPPPDADYFPKDYVIDWVRVYQKDPVPVEQLPYPNDPHPIPGKIEAENFDSGGQGISYFDTNAENMGGQYRQNEWVDIEECADNGGGYNIGWVREGEWLEYTVDVESPYVYHFSARVSSLENGGDFTFKVLSDESEVFSEQIIFGPTGGWQNWETIPIGDAALQQGMHILRFETSSEDYNINYFEAESTAPIVVSNSWFLH